VTTRQAIERRLDAIYDRLVALSLRIHAKPELAFEEHAASSWLADELTASGFRVQLGAGDLPTALLASAGSGSLRIGFCAEYDALPDIGHACGHNMIAAMAVGAAVALAEVADDLDLEVRVIGTPAEEVGDGGGKILLLERGVFADLHAAMMVHPAPFDVVAPTLIALSSFQVRYCGVEAHASGFPDRGVNAADALMLAQMGISLLRQQLRPTDRVHGITTKGGDAPNVIPARTEARYMVRAATLDELSDVARQVERCFEAGALATGCRLAVVGGDRPYAHMVHDRELAAFYRRNAEALGRRFEDSPDVIRRAAMSTDMGNVSLAMPAIHPLIGIDSGDAVNHQQAFAGHCVSEAARRAIWDGALALAWTAADAAADTEVRARLLDERRQCSPASPGSPLRKDGCRASASSGRG
jgi:amidohydrolase